MYKLIKCTLLRSARESDHEKVRVNVNNVTQSDIILFWGSRKSEIPSTTEGLIQGNTELAHSGLGLQVEVPVGTNLALQANVTKNLA